MAKRSAYEERATDELAPVRDGRQYRAREVKVIDDACAGCCAAGADKALCNALPPCGRSGRLDGRNVVFADCGPAAPRGGGEARHA